jgi:peroxiredoxin
MRFSLNLRFWLWFGLLAVSITINVLEARYIGTLLDTSDLGHAQGGLSVGVSVPPLEVHDSPGKVVTLKYGDSSKPTLIYVFRPSCVWCQRNSDVLNSFTDRVSDRYRVIGISLSEEGLPDFVAAHGIGFPVYSSLSTSTINAYRLGTTPETIVISPRGTVLGSWNGAYTGGTKKAVEKFFGMSIPDLRLSGSS